ncbi:MAG: carbohydrate porin [Gammaproteobacteria bacterium]|nr:carbohydrate porin [Gammaproteobacteria bacterium]
MRVRGQMLMLLLGWAGLHAADARAADPGSDLTQQGAEERFAIHGQVTYVEQETNDFNAPYSGPHSLVPSQGREIADATLFIGARLWPGAESWMDPELEQGFGLSNTLGVAGFPSGEAYKVGAKRPYFRLQRAFIRQTIDGGGEREAVEGAANQLAGMRSLDRWVFTVGKFAVTDVFDTSPYAHEPRNDFLNWAAVDAGTFDYAADSWGFTEGAAAELYRGAWTLRAGVFELSKIPNGETLEHSFDEFQLDAEVERRYGLSGHPGRILVTFFDSRGRMGRYDQAIALSEATGTTPNTANVRRYRSRSGGSFELEQSLNDGVAVFARGGRAQGDVEIYEFSDIDRSIAIGTSIKGSGWRRPKDTLGIVALDNRISGVFEEYLSRGGLGILIGDGRLPHPGDEKILETSYGLAPLSWIGISLDYQWIKNPAYNTQRGPVSIWTVRVHAEI